MVYTWYAHPKKIRYSYLYGQKERNRMEKQKQKKEDENKWLARYCREFEELCAFVSD